MIDFSRVTIFFLCFVNIAQAIDDAEARVENSSSLFEASTGVTHLVATL